MYIVVYYVVFFPSSYTEAVKMLQFSKLSIISCSKLDLVGTWENVENSQYS